MWWRSFLASGFLSIGCVAIGPSTLAESDAAHPPVSAPSRAEEGALVGPDKISAGKSAIVRIDHSLAGNEFDWLVLPSGVNWISGENRQETFVILLDLDPGRYFVSFSSFDKQQHLAHVVEVEGTAPSPTPVPPVPPSPPSPLPDVKYKLASQARAWTASIPVAGQSKAKPLANSFRGIVAAIAAGTLTQPSDILSQTRTSNNAALGDAVGDWKDWGAKLQAALETLDREGVLRATDDYRTAWEEIATGLEAVPQGLPTR